jgi:transposase
MPRHSIAITLTDAERHKLEIWCAAFRTPQQVAQCCRIVIAAADGQQDKTIADDLNINRKTVTLWRRRFREQGSNSLWKIAPGRGRKPVFQQSELKNAIFALVHSPPSQHNINRTTWRLADIRQCLLAQGISVSRATISRIVRAAGYTWSKATEVLTSNDPEYQKKLERIKSVLSTLGENDRFCSIDEYGPFAIKMKGGTRLVGPGEHPHVPQFQKSKGSLIVTAALELSQNQVTHFYSKAKNTTEMIRLLEVLLEKYKECDTLYLSWDAASWHASEALL